MEKMLIADDNRQITAVLTAYARKEGFEPVVAYDGEEALAAYRREAPAVILLDVMMPKLDGFEVCRQIREESAVPIIMITARGEDFEKIMGLDIGADDYIVKPFSGGEVMARVRAILRRLSRDGGARLQFFSYKGLTIDLDTYTTTVDGEVIPLTKKETELLWTLAANRQKVFSRDNLLDAVWGYDYYGDNRTVDSHIRRLRAKLDKRDHSGWSIATIWGVGYRFEVNDGEA
ncbi:response regulator transcription factor [Eubacterium limosum]|uniref:Stage 0 sporulation protein A homolog n=1 Tax=Eubacterium limosum TaxID=1736 RepID=A0AAC9QXK4_EUBLI|nr:response regulator transcription factor [Eubacterium limosum]ARD67599.1 DNA-binding response regulator [Eubacterium limosum]PWW56335.1 winged helix family two component transcriptional regulator [Eubacterium limosum]UQZ23615.1 response regulator transcription factor [Eubacterium limosum]